MSTRARAVLLIAQQEARRLGHEAVAPEHVLAGLLTEARGIAAQVLVELGVSLEAIRSEARSAYGSSSRAEALRAAKAGGGGIVRRGPALPYLPVARRLLEQASREAAALSEEVVATEHLLLAFTTDLGDAPARLLERLGHSAAHVRERVIDVRAARQGPGEPPEATAAQRDGPRRGAPVERRAPRAIQPADRRRWSVSSGRDPLEVPAPTRPTGPFCPGCGGLLEGHLVGRNLAVEDLGAPGGTSPPLRVVWCSSCGHVLDAATPPAAALPAATPPEAPPGARPQV